MANKKKSNVFGKKTSESKKQNKQKSLFRRIVNFFIFTGISILVIILLLLGFSQTKTFRDILKDKIETAVNEGINGKLNIEDIRGTIFTSLVILEPSLTTGSDTLFSAEKIEVNTILTQLLFKNIFLKKVELDGVKINLLQDSLGIWNLDNLSGTKDTSVVEEADSSSSGGGFPFNIQVNYLAIRDLEFTRKSYENREGENSYSYLNFDDFHIQNANLILKAAVSLSKSNYKLLLQNLEGKTNIKNFALNDLSGSIELSPAGINVKSLSLKTERTDVSISAKLDSLNLFGDVDLNNFKEYPTEVTLYAKPFHFNDLSVFLRDVDFLKGAIEVSLEAGGKFGNLNISKLNVDYLDTHIEGSGSVANLHNPEDISFDLAIRNTKLDYSNINTLLPELELSQYPGLIVNNAFINYKGKPLNFSADFAGDIGNGKLKFNSKLNFEKEDITYDVDFQTTKLNLEPVIGTQTRLNSKGKIKGKGTDPVRISAALNTEISNSLYNGYKVGKLQITANSISKNIDLDISGDVNGSGILVAGNLNLTNEENPVYDLTGTLKNLNLYSFMGDSAYASLLNFDFSANGEGLDLDKTVGSFIVNLDSSEFNSRAVEGAKLQLDLKRDSTFRSINLTSDFLDFNIEGAFKLTDAISLLQYESSMISNSFAEKVADITSFQKEITDSVIVLPKSKIIESEIQSKDIDFEFDFRFKDFALIATLLKNDKLTLDGSGKGKVSNDSSNFSINTDMTIDQFINADEDNIFYLSDSELSLNFTRDNNSTSFDNLFGSVSISGNRLFFGSNVENYSADIVFNQSKLIFNASSSFDEKLKFETDGNIELAGFSDYTFNLEYLWFEYDKLTWSNQSTITMNVTSDSISLSNFNLVRENALVTADGIWHKNSDINFSLRSSNFPGRILSYYVMQSEDKFLDAQIEFSCDVSGNLRNPIIDFNADVRNIGYGKSKFGNLFFNFAYAEKKLATDVSFINNKLEISKPLLTIDGNLPIDLGFVGVEKRIVETDTIRFDIKSTNFQLGTFGNSLPFITNQRGDLNADVILSGTPDNLNLSGALTVYNTFFRARDNNLDYSFDAKISFKDNVIKVDTIKLSNKGGSKYSGNMYLTGGITLDGLALNDIDLNIEGDIALLGARSQAVSQQLYGDLLIASDGIWNLKYSNGRTFFKGGILLKETDITYSQVQNNYKKSANSIIYKFVVDSSKLDQETVEFEQILEAAKQREEGRSEIVDESTFDYEIDIKAENVARAVLILSPSVNQRLIVEVYGDLKFNSRDGEQRAQGAFTLLSGSKLEFFKSFDATGTLRFESDITDPYLDIVASYVSDYLSPENVSTNQQVAVKLFLKGPLSQLGKNLATDPDNIAVYIGSRNIQNNVSDPRYDAADALSFILIGKFKNDLTSKDKNQVAAQTSALENTATSFLGPVLTTFVNSAVGDIINDIQLSQNGEYTKFNVSGKFQKLRYSFGGTTELFQNIYKANLKIEYLFSQNLSIRAERKDPIVSSYGFEEKINELGLKYKFDF